MTVDDIVVIGAGISGLAAAEALRFAGRKVRVLDKARHPGGRCATRRVAAAAEAAWWDTGAQYFTVRHPEFSAWLAPFADAQVVAPWPLRLARQTGPVQFVSAADGQTRWVGVGGMNAWVRRWASDLEGTGVELHRDTRVTSIQRVDERWQIESAADEVFSARTLVLAMPRAQAQMLLPQRPALPGTDLAECLAVMVQAEVNPDWDGLFGDERPLAWVARNDAKPGQAETGSGLWTLHAAPAPSGRYFADPFGDTVVDNMVEAFARLTGVTSAAITVKHVHAWRYALASRHGVPLQMHWVADERLGLCGDWLAAGRVEGAWLSGRAVARSILA